MKICHLADLHLGFRAYHKTAGKGVNQREADVAKAFKEAIDKLIEIDPAIVLVAGDLFHTVRPPNASVIFAFREFKRLRAAIGAPVVIVGGNHETPKSAETTNILSLFREIPDFYCIYNYLEVVEPIEGMRILCAPHNAVIQKPKLAPDPEAEWNILLIHAASEQYRFQARHGMDILRVEEVKPDEWDYVACGDFHSHTVIAPNMIYPGAIERTSTNIWAEADEGKGFVIYDLGEKTHEFVGLVTPRRVVSLGPFLCTQMTAEEVDDLIETEIAPIDLDGAIVRVKLLDIPLDIQRELNHAQIRKYRERALHFQLDMRKPERVVVEDADGLPARGATLEQQFADFVENRFRPDDKRIDREAIKVLGLGYLGQIDPDDWKVE
jgi:DNA repair exonuclease SbcCD nuclease subunit